MFFWFQRRRRRRRLKQHAGGGQPHAVTADASFTCTRLSLTSCSLLQTNRKNTDTVSLTTMTTTTTTEAWLKQQIQSQNNHFLLKSSLLLLPVTVKFSETRFSKIVPLWQKKSKSLVILKGYFSNWQSLESILVNFTEAIGQIFIAALGQTLNKKPAHLVTLTRMISSFTGASLWEMVQQLKILLIASDGSFEVVVLFTEREIKSSTKTSFKKNLDEDDSRRRLIRCEMTHLPICLKRRHWVKSDLCCYYFDYFLSQQNRRHETNLRCCCFFRDTNSQTKY